MSRNETLRSNARGGALALLLALCALPGCALVAGAGMGYVVSQKVYGDVHVAQVRDDVDIVWASVQQTMGYMVDPGTELSVQDYPRHVEAMVEGSEVLVEVEAYDLDRTIVRVTAKKYMSNDGSTAEDVLGRILDRLQAGPDE